MKGFKWTSLLFWLISSLAIFTLIAKEGEPEKKGSTFFLPINQAGTNKSSLKIEIPDNFQQVRFNEVKKTENFLEFIPKNENEKDWTQILSVYKNPGVRAPAIEKIKDKMKTLFQQEVKDFVLLEEDAKSQEHYGYFTLAMSYTEKSRPEVIYMRYYTGPEDMSGIQYVKVLKSGESPKEALTEMKNFIDHISQVVQR